MIVSIARYCMRCNRNDCLVMYTWRFSAILVPDINVMTYLLTYLLTYGVTHCPHRCENRTRRSNYSDLHVLFFGACYPPAQRSEQTVSVAGNRSAAPRRNVRRERADTSGTGRRRQRKLNSEV